MNAKQMVALAIVVALGFGSLLAVGAMVVLGDDEAVTPTATRDGIGVEEQVAVIVASLEADRTFTHVPEGATFTDDERTIACAPGRLAEIVLARELRTEAPPDEVVDSFVGVALTGGWRIEDRDDGETWAAVQMVRAVGGIDGAAAALNVTAADDGLVLVEAFGSCEGQLLARAIGPPPDS